jgi:hypothetical protein
MLKIFKRVLSAVLAVAVLATGTSVSAEITTVNPIESEILRQINGDYEVNGAGTDPPLLPPLIEPSVVTSELVETTEPLAEAASGEATTMAVEGVLWFTVSGNKATIKDCEVSATDEQVAADFDEIGKRYTITVIDLRAFNGCRLLTNVTVPNSVTTIWSYAFEQCTSLTRITIPDSVTNINDGAFSGCTSLTSIAIPDSVANIGEYAFEDCVSLVSVTMGNRLTSIGEYAFLDCISLTSVRIPDSMTSISEYTFYGCTSLASVTIGESVTSIGRSAFRDCTALTGVVIPDSVTSIGDSAFSHCTSLTSMIIPDSVTSMSGTAFFYCTSLESVIIGKNVTIIGTTTFRECTALTSITILGRVTSIGNLAFYGCTSLTSISIPDSVVSIGELSFGSCMSLTSITIPDSVTSIGDRVFVDCTSLTSIVIPNSVTSIGDSAFRGCTSLPSITIPDSVSSIDVQTFSGCTSLISIIIPDSVTNIGQSAFSGCTSLTSIVIPDSVTEIGGSVFYGCSSLESIIIPDSVTSMGSYVFNDCRSLASATIGNSVTSINGYAFYGCKSLTSIEIPDSVTDIGDAAFYGCTSLISAMIGNGVTSIGDSAFSDCADLTTVALGSKVESIGYRAFYGCESLSSISIPDSVVSIGDYAFYDCTSLESAVIGNGVTSIGVLAFSGCTDLTAVTLGSKVGSIGSQAFYNCVSLTSIKIPDSVASLGYDAFRNCSSLESAVIGKGLTSIGDYTFEGCTKLTTVTLGSKVGSIGDQAFYDCGSLTSIKIPESVTSIGYDAFRYCTSLSSIIIPNSVTSIGSNAFAGCSSLASITIGNGVTIIDNGTFSNGKSLTSIIIPNSVTSIESNSFYLCTSLTSIIIPDSVTNIGNYVFTGCKSLTIYCNPGSYAETYAKNNNIPYRYIGKLYGTTAPSGQISIKVLNNVSPVSGATVTLNSFLAATDSTGTALVGTAKAASYILSVEKEGFYSYSETFQSLPLAKIVFLSEIGDDYLSVATLNGENILNTQSGINAGSKNDVEFKFEFSSDKTVENYTIINGDFKETSTNGAFSIKANKFKEGIPVSLEVALGAGNVVKIPLDIVVNDFSAFADINLIIDILEGNFEIKIPSNIPIIGGTSFKFHLNTGIDIPITYHEDGDSVYVGMNFNVSKDTVKNINAALREKIKKNNLTNRAGIPPKFSVDYSGYVQMKSSGKNKFSAVSGAVIISVSAGAGFDKTFVVMAIPIAVEAKVSGSGTATIRIMGYDFEKSKLLFPNLDLGFGIGIGLEAGLGVANVAEVGVYGSLKSDINFQIIPTPMKVKSWSMSGDVGVYAQLLSLRKSLSIAKGKYDIIKETSVQQYLLDESNYHPVNPTQFSAYNNSVSTASESGILRENINDFAKPQMVSVNGKTILVYLDNNSQRDNYNFQTLVYQVLENGVWSAPRQLDANNTFDADFSLATNGSDVYIAYTEANRQLTAADDISAIASKMEISVAKFNLESNSFDNFSTLTSDNLYDNSPIISLESGLNPVVVWQRNDSNDVFGQNYNNSILKAENVLSEDMQLTWETNIIVTNLSTITSLDYGVFAGANEKCIAFVYDNDASLLTDNDRNIGLINSQNVITNLTTIPGLYSDVNFHQNTLYWYDSGNIAFATNTYNINKAFSDDQNVTVGSDFQIYSMPNGSMIFAYTMPVSDDNTNGSDVFAVIYDGTWHEPIRLTYTSNYVDDFALSAVNGVLSAAYTTADVVFTGDNITKHSDLVFESVEFKGKPEIIATEIDKSLIDVTIRNDGNATINGFVVNLFNNSGALISSASFADTINSNEEITVEFEHLLPDFSSDSSYYLEIGAGEKSDKFSLDLCVSDLRLEAEHYLNENSEIISLSITNDGYAPSGGILEVYDGGLDGVLIYSDGVEELRRGETVTFEISPSQDLSTAKTKLLTFVIVANNAETDTLNNSDSVNVVGGGRSIVYGDADGDGAPTNKDVVLLKQYLADWDVEIFDGADADGDGEPTNKDVVLLKQYLADWDVTLG